MSEDGNTNLNTGWFGTTSFFITAFDLYNMTFQEVYLSEKNTIRTALFVLAGIFVVSYLVGRRN
jgi:hypothetical protein